MFFKKARMKALLADVEQYIRLRFTTEKMPSHQLSLDEVWAKQALRDERTASLYDIAAPPAPPPAAADISYERSPDESVEQEQEPPHQLTPDEAWDKISKRMERTDYYMERLRAAPQISPSIALHPIAAIKIGSLDEPFSTTLLRLIDATGKKDSVIYRRANIDRRHFSKIRGNVHYAPKKPTVLAFAIALELNINQTSDLLKRAGYALSPSILFDVIVEYFIINGKYDISLINDVLLSRDQPLLGA